MRPRIMIIILLLSLLLSTALVSSMPQETGDGDLKDLLITMKQENQCGCIGCCATYSVTISGDGTVTYEGTSAVKVTGKQVYSIQIDQVKELVREFYRVDFFSLKDKYTSVDKGDGTYEIIDHAAPVTTSITIRGRTKSVYDFYGAPEKLKELEKKIYEISGVGVYVKRAS
jgi:hypothetical protein